MEKNKRHDIKTIEDIFNCVNTNNVENFIAGFNELLRSYTLKVESERAKIKAKNIDDTIYENTDIVSKEAITYVDDDNQNNKITFNN